MTRGRILVVEDNPLNRELVVDLLEAAGYTVLQSPDGIGLVERARQEPPNLILLDIQLPVVDGLTVARQLKADPATREIPLLATTAYAQQEDRERLAASGIDDYLCKPLDTRRLLATVARVLARRRDDA